MQLPPLGQVREKIRTTVSEISPLHKYVKKPGQNYFEYPANNTSLIFHTVGLGDVMMVQQFGRAFETYLSKKGDPDLGTIVVTSGGYGPKLDQKEGDFNAYWWYSHGPMDDRPEEFLENYLDPHLDVSPDVILCGSRRIQREAEQYGFETLYFPIAQYGFFPLDLEREGLGYAGSHWHKSPDKIRELLGPFRNRPDFEWVSEFSLPEQLNLWYNSRSITFGVTKEGQRKWGVVNSRVYEALGSATPFIIREHPSLSDELGFNYPFQATSSEEARKLVTQFQENREEIYTQFRKYSEMIQEQHSYENRIETLFDYI